MNSVTPNSEIDIAHRDMVSDLLKPAGDILSSLNPTKIDVLHSAVGVCTEAGELLDAAKKFVFYGKPLDLANVIEELGDLEFYMQAVRRTVGCTREETLVANMKKLAIRYKNHLYSDQQAIDRADKA